jgi:hypothetical protein
MLSSPGGPQALLLADHDARIDAVGGTVAASV